MFSTKIYNKKSHVSVTLDFLKWILADCFNISFSLEYFSCIKHFLVCSLQLGIVGWAEFNQWKNWLEILCQTRNERKKKNVMKVQKLNMMGNPIQTICSMEVDRYYNKNFKHSNIWMFIFFSMLINIYIDTLKLKVHSQKSAELRGPRALWISYQNAFLWNKCII